MRPFLIIVLTVLVLLALRLSVYTVDAAEFAYVTVLGKPMATLDGSDADHGAGLHVGWPWPIQAVQRLDRRLQHFDLPAAEILTHDAAGNTVDKTLSVEAYVCWRIADVAAVDLFIKSLGTTERARTILGQRVNSLLGAAITQMAMDDLVSTEPGKEAGATRVEDKMAYLRSQLLDALRGPLRKDYGIQLVDLRLRRFSYPGNVREEIYRRIRSERQKIVTEYESEGDRKAKDIETKAEETKRDLLAKAKFEEDKLRGKAETEAMVIRNEAHQQDPEFYDFLNRMGKLQNILADNKTVLLLSTHRPLFDLLFQPPRPGLKGPPPTNKDEKSLKKEDKNSKAAGGSK